MRIIRLLMRIIRSLMRIIRSLMRIIRSLMRIIRSLMRIIRSLMRIIRSLMRMHVYLPVQSAWVKVHKFTYIFGSSATSLLPLKKASPELLSATLI